MMAPVYSKSVGTRGTDPKQAWYKAWCKGPGVASRQVARRVTMRGTTSINIKAILLLYM